MEVLVPDKVSAAALNTYGFSYNDSEDVLINSSASLWKDGKFKNEFVAEVSNDGNGKRRVRFEVKDFEAGDVIRYFYDLQQKRASIPGQFSLDLKFQTRNNNGNAIFIDYPVGLKMSFDSWGFKKTLDRTSNGRQRVQWQGQPIPAGLGGGGVDRAAFTPHIYATSFRSFGDIALAYAAESGARPFDDVNAQNLALTLKGKTVSDTVRSISRWIQNNIEYNDVGLSHNGFKASDVHSIMEARSGDCKDHVILLQSLLAYVGIDSNPALLDLESNFSLPKVAISQAFNHVILWIPGLEIYVDPSTGEIPYGQLAESERGKLALIVGIKPYIKRTPSTFAIARIVQTTSIDIDDRGSFSRVSRVDASGIFGMQLRKLRFGKAKLAPTTEGRVISVDDRVDDDVYTVSGRDHLSPQLGAILKNSPFFQLPISLAGVARLKASSRFENRAPCFSAELEENYSIHKNTGEIKSASRDFGIQVGNVSYNSKYEMAGRSLIVHRHLSIERRETICEASELNELLGASKTVFSDLGQGLFDN